MTPNIPKYLMFNSFLVFFIIHTTQMGIGVAGVQRIIYKESKQDAWISIIWHHLSFIW
ncbi:GerAB/ArcD/ProY family transporter [Bacillus sp. CGMCC 1.16607]|uniref:GerAB/ArcD/ProY family transporter n=1 Tax=Bacillus sp. CGMCC 1.16607 TaxID=3351842 RepID=UPI00363CF63D